MNLRIISLLTIIFCSSVLASEVPDELRKSIEDDAIVCSAYEQETDKQDCLNDVVARHLQVWEKRQNARIQSERQQKAKNSRNLNYEQHRISGHTWQRKESIDLVSGKKNITFVVKSTNTHRFKFPYSGDQYAVLTLRNHPRFGRSIMLQLSKGQFVCNSFDGCNVTVRIGDASPRNIIANPPADYSLDLLFLGGRSASKIWNEIAKADRVVISAVVYLEGAPSFEFFTMQPPKD